MDDIDQKPLQVVGRRPDAPARKPRMSAYERNGWIGLVATLVICAAAYAAWLVFRDDDGPAERPEPLMRRAVGGGGTITGR